MTPHSPKPNPPKPNSTKQSLTLPRVLASTDAALAVARMERERDYLLWARRAITAWRWNRECPSARCRRNGCLDISRCEPHFHDALVTLRLTLCEALVEENALCRDVPEDKGAPARRALLADARAKGMLPF